jgi:FMN phosphatase YigB (HAD superfamily)
MFFSRLKSLEWAMIHPSLVRAIASKFAVGIVTGRPRKDMDEFLNRFQIRELFGNAVFCMEDGPAKPSCAGIDHVLKQLHIQPNQVFKRRDKEKNNHLLICFAKGHLFGRHSR